MNARYGTTERRRLVAVTSSRLRESSHMSPLGQRWWELTLHCGHTVERGATYRQYRRQAGARRARSKRDLLPAPRRARCDRCPEITS